jgi:hypothetical protein
LPWSMWAMMQKLRMWSMVPWSFVPRRKGAESVSLAGIARRGWTIPGVPGSGYDYHLTRID